MKDILTFLEEEGISEKLLEELRSFRSFYKLEEEDEKRLMKNGYLIPAADFTDLREVLVLKERKDDRFQKESKDLAE